MIARRSGFDPLAPEVRPQSQLWTRSVCGGVLALLSSQCSAPNVQRLSPEAYARLNDPTLAQSVEEARAKARREHDRLEAARVLANSVDLTRDAVPIEGNFDVTRLARTGDEQARIVSALSTWDPDATSESTGLLDASKLRAAVQGVADAERDSRRANADAKRLIQINDEIEAVQSSGASAVYADQIHFSFVPLVAFRGGLEATAIPSVAVNVQPFDLGGRTWLDPLGLQAVFGGVLNPQDDDGGPEAAVGAGVWYPIGSAGSLGVGYVMWDDDSETRSGVYVAMSLGQERKKVEKR